MQAYEFFATPKDGCIPIPERYRNLITESVMVIVLEKRPPLYDRDALDGRLKSDLLPPPIMKTKGWKFNREEANLNT